MGMRFLASARAPCGWGLRAETGSTPSSLSHLPPRLGAWLASWLLDGVRRGLLLCRGALRLVRREHRLASPPFGYEEPRIEVKCGRQRHAREDRSRGEDHV